MSQTFGLGAALAAVPLVAGLAYAVDSLQELTQQNERLMLRQLAAVRLGTGVGARLERLSEYQRKYAVSQDAGYAQKLEETAQAVDAELARLEARALVEDAAPFIAFSTRWREYRARSIDDEGAVLLIDELSSGARDLLQRAADAAAADAAEARRARTATLRAAVVATALAIVSSVAVIVLVVRRLRRRLAAFVEATGAVARGTFSTQLAGDTGADELGRVAEAFNRMVSALDQLEKMKADFLSSISHELRTPLVAMAETNQALLDDIAGPLSPQQRRLIELNHAAAQRLSGMIGDLLELSVVRAGLRYSMAPRALGPLVTDAASELAMRARDREQRLTVEAAEGLVCVVDADRVTQVVQNLVENAIRHTPRGGAIEVRVARASPRDVPSAAEGLGYALVRVDDAGPGIPPEDRERVFEKFFRRQGVSSDGGAGLGLAISKEIVAAHQGMIWVDTSPLGGASMRVALPLSPEARA